MKGKNKAKEILIPLATVIAFVTIWQIVCVLGLVPGFMLPSPIDVGSALVSDFPLLMHHAGVTMLEAFLGL